MDQFKTKRDAKFVKKILLRMGARKSFCEQVALYMVHPTHRLWEVLGRYKYTAGAMLSSEETDAIRFAFARKAHEMAQANGNIIPTADDIVCAATKMWLGE